MRSSDLGLRGLALAIALALMVVVRSGRVVTVSFSVPLTPRLPPALVAARPLPADVSVSLTGPWSRLRAIDPTDLGPLVADLSRATAGSAPWSVRPEALHLPRGVRVDSIYPSQGTVELRSPPAPAPARLPGPLSEDWRER